MYINTVNYEYNWGTYPNKGYLINNSILSSLNRSRISYMLNASSCAERPSGAWFLSLLCFGWEQLIASVPLCIGSHPCPCLTFSFGVNVIWMDKEVPGLRRMSGAIDVVKHLDTGGLQRTQWEQFSLYFSFFLLTLFFSINPLILLYLTWSLWSLFWMFTNTKVLLYSFPSSQFCQTSSGFVSMPKKEVLLPDGRFGSFPILRLGSFLGSCQE